LSLPLNHEPTHGKLHVNIDRCREVPQLPTNAEGVIESSIDITIRPPDAIPVFNLVTTEFVMAICETKNRTIARKRPKRQGAKSAPDSGQVEALLGVTTLNSEASSRSDALLTSACQSKAMEQGENTHAYAHLSRTPSEPNLNPNPASPNREKRKVSISSSDVVAIGVTNDMLSESARIAALTDAALRFSISLNLRGSTANFKVKANTFIHGLVNVAPALWRAGYTSVCRVDLGETPLYMIVTDPMQACAHVMYTAPTLTRSLDRLSSSARSATLKDKIAELKDSYIGGNHEHGLGSQDLVGDTASTIADRLWCHVQRTQMSKSTSSPVKSLCSPGLQVTSAGAAIEILEEYIGLDTRHQGENSEQVHNNPMHNSLFDTEQSLAQSQLNRDISFDAIEPSMAKFLFSICPD
jgi:hypothetical protein